MSGGFNERVYKEVMKIPRGKVATYGQIAALAGKARGSGPVPVGSITASVYPRLKLSAGRYPAGICAISRNKNLYQDKICIRP